MNCSLCPNKDKRYFECDPVVQTNLFSFSNEISVNDKEPDELVLDLLKISCDKR